MNTLGIIIVIALVLSQLYILIGMAFIAGMFAKSSFTSKIVKQEDLSNCLFFWPRIIYAYIQRRFH